MGTVKVVGVDRGFSVDADVGFFSLTFSFSSASLPSFSFVFFEDADLDFDVLALSASAFVSVCAAVSPEIFLSRLRSLVCCLELATSRWASPSTSST